MIPFILRPSTGSERTAQGEDFDRHSGLDPESRVSGRTGTENFEPGTANYLISLDFQGCSFKFPLPKEFLGDRLTGRTQDSGSCYLGSSPSGAAIVDNYPKLRVAIQWMQAPYRLL